MIEAVELWFGVSMPVPMRLPPECTKAANGLKEANEQWALLNGATSHQPKLRFRQFD